MTDLEVDLNLDQAAIAAERKARLKAAVKQKDGWWATVFTSKLSIRVVSFLGDTAVTPNQVTAVSLLVALVAAALFYVATPVTILAAAVLIQVAFVFDCADGQLARFKQMKSDLGGWYDQVADRAREFALLLGLVGGYYRQTGDEAIWPIGFVAFFVLFMLEYYSQQNCQIPVPVDPSQPPSRVQKTGAEGFDAMEGALDRIFPIAAFRMGEQLLIVTLFGLFAGIAGLAGYDELTMPAIYWLMICICLLGGAHAVYRPVRRLKAYYNSRRVESRDEARGRVATEAAGFPSTLSTGVSSRGSSSPPDEEEGA